jgi:hypothetical protein
VRRSPNVGRDLLLFPIRHHYRWGLNANTSLTAPRGGDLELSLALISDCLRFHHDAKKLRKDLKISNGNILYADRVRTWQDEQ